MTATAKCLSRRGLPPLVTDHLANMCSRVWFLAVPEEEPTFVSRFHPGLLQYQ